MVHAHGPIPIPIEAVNKMLDRTLPIMTDPVAKDNTNFPPIADDFNALASKDGRVRLDAYKRLIARGDKATPEIIRRMSDPNISLLEKKRLVNLLGIIKTPGSEKNIIEFTEELRGLDENVRKLKLKIIYHQTFRALSKYKDTSKAIDYANTLLNDKTIDPVVHARALFFLADQNVPGAKKWIDIFNKKNIHIDVQYAILYLGGKLGIDSNTQETINFLKNMPKSQKNYRHETHLLLGNLTHTVPAEELRNIIKIIKNNNARFIADRKINSFPLFSELYIGEKEQRTKAALALLNGWNKNHTATIESLKFMISINDASPYINLWKLHHPALIRYVAHLGYIIDLNSSSIGFIKKPDSFSIKTPEPDNLVRSLLDSFINGDIDSFKSSLLLNKDLFKVANQNGSKKDKTKSFSKKYRSNAISAWRTIYDKSSSGKFKWSNIEYKSYENRILIGINGTHLSTIKILFEENNKTHKILLENCILIDNKWFILSGIKLL